MGEVDLQIQCTVIEFIELVVVEEVAAQAKNGDVELEFNPT